MNEVNYDLRLLLKRHIFNMVWLIFCRYSPRPLNFIRVGVLRVFGAKIGPRVIVYGSSKIWWPANLEINEGSCVGPDVFLYNVSTVKIGSNTIISQGATICTPSHNFMNTNFKLISRDISIGSNCWIAMNAFVCPEVDICDGVILGARSVATHELMTPGIYLGNPAQLVKEKKCIQFSF
jgi:putative colanic acid biosynthesis acetyltransferase WcaF